MLNKLFVDGYSVWLAALLPLLVAVLGLVWIAGRKCHRKNTAWDGSAKDRRIRQLVERISDVLWLGSSDYTYLEYVNPAFEKLWGYPCRKLYDDPMFWTRCLLSADRRMVLDALENCRVNRDPDNELPDFRIVSADGTTRWINARLFSFEAPQDAGARVAIVFKDISENKNVMESESFGRTLFKEAPMGMAIQDFSAVEFLLRRLTDKDVIDLRGYLANHPEEVTTLARQVTLVAVNPALVAMYKADGQEMVTGPISSFLLEDDRQHFIDQVVKFASGEDYFEGEGRNVDFKGNTVHAMMRKVVLQRSENGLSKVLAQLVDITSLKTVQQERESLSAQLQQAQKMEAIGTLAGGVAHDFNNILGIILGNAELAMEDMSEEDPALSNISEIQSAVSRARGIVKQLLKISRKTDKRRRTCINLVPLIEESVSFLRATIPANVYIDTFFSADSDVIYADATQIHQIMINLCTNASHAMETDGGLLSIWMDNVNLRDNMPGATHPIKAGSYVRLTVSDTGMGIADEIKENIFEPFFTTKETEKGTGMGLCMVQSIMEKHGGGILLDTALGKGTSFMLYFPSIGEPVDAIDDMKIGIAAGSERILLVDDESLIADLAEKMLKRLGYRVTSCTDVWKALSLFEAEPTDFDLVISDMAMPGLTGCQFIKRIRQVAPTLPVILCSGYIERISAKQIESLDISDVIAKPVSLRGLAVSIRQALDSNRDVAEPLLKISG